MDPAEMPLKRQLDHLLWLMTFSVAHAEGQATSSGSAEYDQWPWFKLSFSKQRRSFMFLCLFGVSVPALQERDADSVSSSVQKALIFP